MIRYQPCERWMIPQLIELWQEVFGDSESYIRSFYTHWFSRAEVYTAVEDETVVGMAHTMPFVIKTKGREQPAMYLYAGAVKESYRCQGIFSELIALLKRNSDRYGYPLLFIPRSRSLVPYYISHGFREIPISSEVTVTSVPCSMDVSEEKLTAQDFYMLRNSAFANIQDCALWDTEALSYALLEWKSCGGFANRLTLQGQQYYILAVRENSILRIMETSVPYVDIPQLGAYFGCENVRYRTMPNMPGNLRYGMYYSSQREIPHSMYFNLDLL